MKNKKGFFSELLLILILLALVWEGFVLYNFYQNADEVECTWYYCKFTKVESKICFIEGEDIRQEVSCNDLAFSEILESKIRDIERNLRNGD